MEFGILGPLQVLAGGRELRLGRSREQKVLAALLLDADRVVPLDRLVDAVWDDQPPDTAGKLIRNCVSTLRRHFAEAGEPDDVIATDPAGYAVRVGAHRLDAQEFARRTAQARQLADAGQLAEAVAALRAATSLWRGPALAGMPGRLIRAAAAALDEQRIAALEECLAHELALGRSQELVAELSALVAEHPLRERLRGQLMLALYRCGRRADALDVYRRGRRTLVDELGLEPGPELRALEHAILADDGGLTAAPVGAPTASGAAPPAHRPVPAQLPAEIDTFAGRSDQLRQLDELLIAGEVHDGGTRPRVVPVVAVVGAPGVGKTTLAVHWAHRVRDRFPDGQLYVNLRGYSGGEPTRPIEALSMFLTGLGIPVQQVPVEVDAAAAMYRSLVADRRLLLLLDNAANAEQVRPLLPGSRGCAVVVTCRERLGGLVARDGARLLSLDVLRPAEACGLLARAIGTERADAEPDAIGTLARVCAYLPLALRIAAAHLTERPHRSVGRYAAGLLEGDTVDALAVDGDEETAVRRAFDLSYAALPADTQRVFRRLGLAPGVDLTVGAVGALAGTDDEPAARGLDRLAGAHLVAEYADGRYTFHDLLRRYAADRAREEDGDTERQAARARLLDWYLRHVGAAARLLYPEILRLPATSAEAAGGPRPVFHDSASALDWLDTERANLIAIITSAGQHGAWSRGWTLADMLRGYFHQRMCTVDWLAAARAGLAAAEHDGNLRAQAAAELSLGDLHWRLSRYPPAIEHYSRAEVLAGRAGWRHGRGAVLGNLGNVYQQSGQLAEAAVRYRDALAIADQIGWIVGQAANLENLGAVCWESGRLREAVGYNVRAADLCRGAGFRFAEGVVRTGLGEVYQALGRLDDAVEQQTLALRLHREVGNRGGEAETTRVLGAVLRDRGRYVEALDVARSALGMARDAGDRRYEADALNTVASIRRRLGQVTEAVETHRQALTLAREIGNRYPEVEAQLGLACGWRTLGEIQAARACARDGLAIARGVGYRVLEGETLAVLAEIERTDDRFDEAGRLAEQAHEIRCETGYRPADDPSLTRPSRRR